MNFWQEWNNMFGNFRQYWSSSSQPYGDLPNLNSENLVNGMFGDTDDSDYSGEANFNHHVECFSNADNTWAEPAELLQEPSDYNPEAIQEHINALYDSKKMFEEQAREYNEPIKYWEKKLKEVNDEVAALEAQWNSAPYEKKS